MSGSETASVPVDQASYDVYRERLETLPPAGGKAQHPMATRLAMRRLLAQSSERPASPSGLSDCAGGKRETAESIRRRHRAMTISQDIGAPLPPPPPRPRSPRRSPRNVRARVMQHVDHITGGHDLGAWLRYRFDEFFAVYDSAKYVMLVVITLVMILFGGALYTLVSDEGFANAMWVSWTMVADPGTHAEEEGSGRRVVGIILTLGGMLFFALLVGLIGEGIAEAVDDLKKGKSRVLEENHSLILGWSSKTIPAIRQLCLANESEGGGVVVVMAPLPKEEMDETVFADLGDELRGSTVVTRSGNPIDVYDLRKCSVAAARSITVLSPAGEADEADAEVVRTCLALSSFPALGGHIVVELCDIDNLDIVRLAMSASRVDVIPIVAHDVIGRVMVQASREPGLSSVFGHLLEFDRNEVYMDEARPELVGMPFGSTLFAFAGAVPIGVLHARGAKRMELLPAWDYALVEGDRLVVIAEDNDTYDVVAPVAPSPGPAPQVTAPPQPPENVLICGWRRDVEDLIHELANWVAEGSRITLLCPLAVPERRRLTRDNVLPAPPGVHVEHVVGHPILRRDLSRVDVASYDCVLVLSEDVVAATTLEEEQMGVNADSRSLVTTLLVRDIQSQVGRSDAVVVVEIKDERTQSLIPITDASDCVVSSDVAAMIITQVSETPEMALVFDELFKEDGPELHIKHAWLYAHPNEQLSFAQIQARAMQCNHIVFGYKKEGMEDFEINPADTSEVHTWTAADYLCVVSED